MLTTTTRSNGNGRYNLRPGKFMPSYSDDEEEDEIVPIKRSKLSEKRCSSPKNNKNSPKSKVTL